MSIIKPTIGRRVWFWPPKDSQEAKFAYSDQSQPCDAGIAYVWGDRMVNLTVADQNGAMHSRTSITLVQPGDPVPEYGNYCEWIPYQVGQAGHK